VRVVLAEDSLLLREGLVRLLQEAGHEVVAAVGDARALLSAAERLPVDIAVIDVRMPPTHTDEGLRAAIELRRRAPGMPVLVLSQFVEPAYTKELLADGSGAVGYLLKDRVLRLSEFTDALERVAAGGTALDPEVVAQLLVRRRSGPLDTLSPRERQVLSLMAEGRSNSAIAQRLRVSEGAVEKHVSSIFTKLTLVPSEDDHRRVLAVVAFLQS
jgi:DNA-binding NarL/FixJ family response regulator